MTFMPIQCFSRNFCSRPIIVVFIHLSVYAKYIHTVCADFSRVRFYYKKTSGVCVVFHHVLCEIPVHFLLVEQDGCGDRESGFRRKNATQSKIRLIVFTLICSYLVFCNLGGRVHIEANNTLSKYNIASLSVQYQSRIVWANLKCHELFIIS